MKILSTGSAGMVGAAGSSHSTSRKTLLVCGILASTLWLGADIFAAMRYEGYSYTAQAISELTAVGAPTRLLLVQIVFIHTLLKMAFAVGIWMSAGPKRSLRITAGLLLALGIIDLATFFAPMNQREVEKTLTDLLHSVAGSVTVLLMLLIVGFGARADGKWFHLYSYATLVVLMVADVLTFMDALRLAENLPTPWLGLEERSSVYGYMLWMMMLAVVLLRAQPERAKSASGYADLQSGVVSQ
jgi:hypothetical protein